MKLMRDTWLIFRRSLVLTLRQPVWIVFGMMVPVLYLVLFGPLLEGAMQSAGTGPNAFNWFVPGLILMVQATIMIVLAIPFGLQIDPQSIVAMLGLLLLIGLSVAPLSYAGALYLKTEDAFAPAVNAIALPLLLLSGILLPMALAPDWLQFLSNINPLTHAVDAARALFNGDWGNPDVAVGVGISAIFAIFAVWIGSRSFSRAVA